MHQRIIMLAFVLAFLTACSSPLDESKQRLIQLEKTGEPLAVANEMRTQVAIDPTRASLWEKIAENEVKAGRAKEANEAYTQGAWPNSLSANGWLKWGELQEESGNLAGAILTWRHLISTSNPPTEVFNRLISLQRRLADLDGAAATLRRQIEIQPSPEVYLSLALVIAPLHPQDALDTVAIAGNLPVDQEQQADVLRKAINIALLKEDQAYRQLIIGRALGTIGNWDLAALAFEGATEAQPSYAEAWAYWGEARQQMKLDGWPQLEKAISIDPQSAIVNALVGIYYRRYGQAEKALVYLSNASKLEPDQPMWLVEIGNTQKGLGNLNEAIDLYQQAANKDPGNPVYWTFLVEFCLEKQIQVRETALPAGRRVVESAPQAASSYDLMGRIFLYLQDQTSAERFLQHALAMDSNSAAIQLHLGQLYLQQNDLAKAHPFLVRSADLAVNNEPVGELARRLLDRYYGEQK